MARPSSDGAGGAMTESSANVMSADIVHETARDALRRLVGPGKLMQADTLAELTGVPRNTIDGHRVRDARMSLVIFLRYAAALPSGFANEVLAPAGLGGAHRLDDVEVDGFATMASMAAEMHELARRLADGRLCHADRAALAPRLRALGLRCQEQAAAMDATATPLRSVG